MTEPTTHTAPPLRTTAPSEPSEPARWDPTGPLAGWAAAAGGALLLAVFVIAPDPDPANSVKAGWTVAQAGHCVAFTLMIVGLPGLARSMRGRLGPAGLVGHLCLLAQLVLSMGSHVYLMWVVPILERHRAALGSLIDGDTSVLHKYYTTHGSVTTVLGIGMLGLAFSVWRSGRGMRVLGVLLALAAVGTALQTGPIGLGFLAIALAWLGLRLALRGSVLVSLRRSS